jgi:hypothetical protein
LKSIIVSVAWVAFMLGHKPGISFFVRVTLMTLPTTTQACVGN